MALDLRRTTAEGGGHSFWRDVLRRCLHALLLRHVPGSVHALGTLALEAGATAVFQTDCRDGRLRHTGAAAVASHPVVLAQVLRRLLESPFVRRVVSDL